MSETLPRVQEVLAGHYRVVRELGQGGMATVYLAEDLKHRRQVAIKVMRPELAASLGGDRFLREIETVARLAHPNILPLHDSGSADGLLYYVMPYVEGESLRARLNRERQLPLDDALRIGEEVADALSHAHAQGVIHRDIKPENILLQAGHAVVADFGIARALTAAGASRLTGTGFAVGTPGYMSPEQATGDLAVDARTDVYALGCVIYEMLGGEPPYTGPTPQAILARVLTEDPRPLVRLRESVTPALDQAVRKALARSPADRFGTPAHFKAALRTSTAAGALAAAPRARVRPRHALLAAGALAAVALGVIVARGILARPATGDDRLGVAVFPFHATLAEAAQWSEQLPDLLATVLDGTPGVRVADPWSLWSGLRTQRGARAVSPADVNDASRLARRAGASRFLLGTIAPDAAGLSMTVRVYRVGSRDPLHTVTLAGSADSLGPLVQRLAVELITRVRPGDAVVVPELEGYATRSAGALKAYLRAKEAMRRGLVTDAEAAIDTALAVDSTFALGLVEAVRIKTWAQFMRGQPFTGLLALLDRAERYADSLSERNRLRLQATRASVRTEGAAAARAARRILQLDSTDFDAWTSLAYFHRTYGWQYGSDASDAVEALERAIRLDSTHVPSLVGQLNLLDNLGDSRAEQYADLLRRAGTASTLARGALLAHRTLLASDADYAALLDTLALQSPPLLIGVLRALRTGRPDRAMTLVNRLRGQQGPGVPDYRPEWGRMLAAQGRLAELDSTVSAGGFPMQTLPRWLLVGSGLAGLGDSARARSAGTFLHDFIPPDSALAWFEKMPVWINGWTVAAHHAMYGDSLITRRWQAAIGTLPGEGTSWDYRGSLQADLEARLLARRGDLEGALAAASRAYGLWAIHTENVQEYHPEPAMRFHYAMLLLATRRTDSAAALLRSLVPPTTWLGFLTARASLELGRLAEDRGDRVDAARYYGIAYRLWQRADPTLASWRDGAREGLRRVTGEVIAP